jgi:hypothetical protein
MKDGKAIRRHASQAGALRVGRGAAMALHK